MDYHHQKFIPSTYWKQILCSIDYDHKEQFLIVACTKQGDLIEFILDSEDNSVKDTNCIDIDDSNVKVMKVYFSLHDPVKIFYLLHTHSDELIVIAKINNQLKLKEKIHKVNKFEISDVNHSGRPQVSIWYTHSKESNLVTDFSDQLVEQSYCGKSNDKLANVLKFQLQMLGDKISERQSLLEDKSKLRSEMFQSVTHNSDKVNLKLNKIIQKTFSGKLFIIMELENIGHIPIADLQFVMAVNHSTACYKSYVIANGTIQIHHIKTVKNKCLGIVMLDMPVFTSETVVIGGTIFFCDQTKNKTETRQSKNKIDIDSTITNTSANSSGRNLIGDIFMNEHCCLTITPIEVNVNCLIDNSYQCIVIGVSTNLHDIYCIMLASYEKSFSISNPISLDLVLSTQLSCSLLSVENQEGSCLYYYSQHGFFSGTLFCIDKSTATLTVYFTNKNHMNVIFLLLKNVVNEVGKSMMNPSDFQADITHCLNILRNEILHDTINESPKDFFSVNKNHIFEIQKILFKYQ